MPPAPATAPQLKINWNPFSETWRIPGLHPQRSHVFLSCLGISWFWFFGRSISPPAAELHEGMSSAAAMACTPRPDVCFRSASGVGSLLCERLSGHKVEIGLVPFGSIGMTVFGVDLYFAHPASSGELGLDVAAILRPAAHLARADRPVADGDLHRLLHRAAVRAGAGAQRSGAAFARHRRRTTSSTRCSWSSRPDCPACC